MLRQCGYSVRRMHLHKCIVSCHCGKGWVPWEGTETAQGEQPGLCFLWGVKPPTPQAHVYAPATSTVKFTDTMTMCDRFNAWHQPQRLHTKESQFRTFKNGDQSSGKMHLATLEHSVLLPVDSGNRQTLLLLSSFPVHNLELSTIQGADAKLPCRH